MTMSRFLKNVTNIICKYYNVTSQCVTQDVWKINTTNVLPNACVRFMTSSQVKNLDVSGIFPPIATPFNRDETLAYDKLEKNMEKWNKIPFRGYVVQGSNGEYILMTKEERIEMVQKVCKMAAKDKLIIAGSGCESTRDTVAMTKSMAEVGAQAVLVVTPCYYKGSMNSAALLNHYIQVADASPVPVLLYSVPANTGLDIPPDVVVQLSTHPNIIGIKDSGGDIARIGLLVHKTKGNNFQVLAGSAGFLLPGYSVGCVGGVCGVANVLGQQCCDIEKLFKANKMSEATELQQKMIAPNAAVTRRYGVPGLKIAMEWFGYYGGPTRSPLHRPTENEIQEIRQAFTEFL